MTLIQSLKQEQFVYLSHPTLELSISHTECICVLLTVLRTTATTDVKNTSNDLAFTTDRRPSQWEPQVFSPSENRPKSEANQFPPHNAGGQRACREKSTSLFTVMLSVCIAGIL